MATKTIWKAAWALERCPHPLFFALPGAALPGSRRHRSKEKKRERPSPRTVESVRNLRTRLEKQANYDIGQAKSPPKGGVRYQLFKQLVEGNFTAAVSSIGPDELVSVGVRSEEDLAKEAVLFRKIIKKAFSIADTGITERQRNPYFWAWRNAFITGDSKNLLAELRHSFISFTVRQHLSAEAIKCHEKLADFRHPHEWFPATRTMQRTFHLHVGPTNSGKTYQALQALEKAKTGLYAGPLRLLAHETFMRMRAKDRRTALLTGEEQRIPDGDEDYLISCTVEMTPLNKRLDVAVIDEIQMIGDEDRGWAWTQAVLGVQAREVHLCGEERAVPLIEALCAKTGDEVIVHRYNRLSGLEPEDKSLEGQFTNLRKGDAVVSFSRVNIHALKRGIEKATGKKCAIVYGSLPPETRAQQAALFNDPDNEYDYLAASDAIGMGLNLEVKRVVFESVSKFDGTKMRFLTLPELKQIGGRAGRFRSAARATLAADTNTEAKKASAGYVTTLDPADLDLVTNSFEQDAPPITAAGIFPPASVVEKFASFFPAGTPLAFILLRLRDIARLSGEYKVCSMRDNIEVARMLHTLPLSTRDLCMILAAPTSLQDPIGRDALVAVAKRIAYNQPGDLLDLPEIPLELLDYAPEFYPAGKNAFLRNLEGLHKTLTLYLWLSYRFNTVFRSQRLAFKAKEMVEEAIDKCLEGMDFSTANRSERLKMARKSIAKKAKVASKVFGDGDLGDLDEKPRPANRKSDSKELRKKRDKQS